MAQTLFRLRSVESEIASLKNSSTPSSTNLQFVDYVDVTTTPISTALTSILVFGTLTNPTISSDFSAAINGTVYRFGNKSAVNVTIQNTVGPNPQMSQTLIVLVPGEYARLIKTSSGWIQMFGI